MDRLLGDMKIACSLVTILFCALSVNSRGEEATVEAALKTVQSTIRSEMESKAKPEAGRPHESFQDQNRMLLGRIEALLARGDTYQIEQALPELQSYAASDEVRKAIGNAVAAVKKDRETKQNAYVAEVNAALKKAGDALRTAKTTQDLDEPLKELARFRSGRNEDRLSEAGRAAVARIQPTLTFLQRWQDYLAAQKSDNPERARQALRELTNNDTMELMPRSQILAELQKYPTNEEIRKSDPIRLDQIEEMVSKVKSLDGVTGLVKELRQIQDGARSRGSSDAVGNTLNALVSIDRTYREFQAGLPTRIEPGLNQSPDAVSASVLPLRVQLLTLVLPRYVGVPPELGSKQGETIYAYLERLSAEARSRGDGALFGRVKNAQRVLSGGGYQGDSGGPEQRALNFYATGKNQEVAGQFMLAVVSYQNALNTGTDAVPVKLIGERLSALQAAHPAEYEAGVKQFLAPPRFPGYSQMGPEPRLPETGNPPFLAIPGAPAAAVPSAAAASTPLATPSATGSVAPTPKPKSK